MAVFGRLELHGLFGEVKPKLVFCQSVTKPGRLVE
jgi:hypothetical protein